MKAHCTVCGRASLFCACKGRHRIDVRGNPIAREPLFPIVRFTAIGVLMFVGVFVGLGRQAPEPVPTVQPVAWEACR